MAPLKGMLMCESIMLRLIWRDGVTRFCYFRFFSWIIFPLAPFVPFRRHFDFFNEFAKIFESQGAPLLSTTTGTVNRKSVESEGFLIFCLDTIANQLTLLDKLFTFIQFTVRCRQSDIAVIVDYPKTPAAQLLPASLTPVVNFSTVSLIRVMHLANWIIRGQGDDN